MRPDLHTIRVSLPGHLQTLAGHSGEVSLDVAAPVTLGAVLDAIEARFPMLKGTIRDHVTLKRRAFVRYYACKKDFSLEPLETQLPDPIVCGDEAFLVIGSIAGG